MRMSCMYTEMDLRELLSVTKAVVAATVGPGAEVPKKLPAGSRACGLLLCVPLCGPCFVWSVLWRVLCCPVQCAFRGPGAFLSNNNCTDATDSCIERYVGEVNAPAKVAALGPALSRPSTPETREEFVQVLQSLRKTFEERTITVAHYALCAKVVSPLSGGQVLLLPAAAAACIDGMIAAVRLVYSRRN